MVDISAAQKLSSPNPFALITSKGERGTNIMALSWWTYCCNHPATVAICIGKRSYSGRCIDQTGQFCLCLPGADIAEAAFRCGTCSGISCDKAATFGIGLSPAATVEPQYVTESRLVLECQVKETLEVGDHNMFIAEVVDMHQNPDVTQLVADGGYSKLIPAK